MKAVVVLLLVNALVFTLATSQLQGISAYEPTFKRFINWLHESGHSYPDQLEKRFLTWFAAEERTTEKNIEARGVEWGITPFSALTIEEFSSYACGLKQLSESVVTADFQQTTESLPAATSIPKSWDWTKHGFNTPVKNQFDCGSCGVFSAVGSIEGTLAAKHNQKVSLSEQQMIDCNPSTQGCTGTWPVLAFKSTLEEPMSGSVNPESVYECKSCFSWIFEKRSQCKFNPEEKAATITGFSEFCNAGSKACDEEAMASYVYNNGPMSVCLDNNLFQDYVSGIIKPKADECSVSNINHCVTLVGYGEDNGSAYWKIKNSWGEKWGEQGYAKIARGAAACGINQVVSAPKF